MKKFILLLFLSVIIVSCGSKGDLVLEPESLPLKITDLLISQVGSDIKLKFSFPKMLSDKQTLEKEDITKVYVYYSETNIPDEKFRKKGSVLLKIKEPLNVILTENDKSIIIIPFKVKDLDMKEHFFGIIYYNKKKRSPMSIIKSIKTVTPYPPINEIEIEQERKLILIKWKKPEFDVLKKRISQIAGFNIYRKIELEQIEDKEKKNIVKFEFDKQEPFFIKINSGFIKDEYFEDRNVSTNGKYFYRVATVYNKKIESHYSKIVTVELKDIYPPDIPENVFVFKGDGFMLLNWEGVKDKDFSHYIIFRKSSIKGQFKKIEDNVIKSRYKDKNVKKNMTFFYYIIAVDKKGNESEPSNTVKERY